MSASNWNRLESLFHALLDMPEAERAALLDRECEDDLPLRREVMRLLEADRAPHQILVSGIEYGSAWTVEVSSPVDQYGHYQVVKPLGSGGMGDVFLAEDTKLRRQVALKVLPAEMVRRPQVRDRFLREAQAVARISHPNVVAVYDVDVSGTRPYIAMEYAPGMSLREKVSEGPRPVDEAVSIARQVAQALVAAHGKGVIHRDLKPDNVTVSDQGVVKVLDFGIAKVLDSDTLTRPGQIMGTAAYMSPEQVRGEAVDTRTDVFSLGAILFELLTGHAPFRRPTTQASLRAVLADEPPSLRKLRPECPPYLEAIVLRCLQKQTSDRYASVSQFVSDLDTKQARNAPLQTLPTIQTTLAVLAPRVAAKDQDIEYVALGLADDLTSLLSRSKALKLAARSAVRGFEGDAPDLQLLAQAVGVQHVLEGTLRKRDGETLDWGLSLSDVAAGHVIWGDTFELPMRNTRTLTREIAEHIALALSLEGDGPHASSEGNLQAVHPDAYDQYLKGRFFMSRRDQVSLVTAGQCFEQAIRLDEHFGAAHGMFASAHLLRHSYGFDVPDSILQQAERSAERAVDLDPGSADAHMALYMAQRRSDYPQALRALRTAVALEPNNAEARHQLAHAYFFAGAFAAAIEQDQAALELNPFLDIARAQLCRLLFAVDDIAASERILVDLLAKTESRHVGLLTQGWIQWNRREWSAATQSLEAALAIQVDSLHSISYLVDCFARQGELDRAQALLDYGLEQHASSSVLQSRQAQLCAIRQEDLGRRQSLDRVLAQLDVEYPGRVRSKSAVYHYNRSIACAQADEAEEALAELKLALQTGYGNVFEVRRRPDLDSLRRLAGWEDLLGETALRERHASGRPSVPPGRADS